MIACVILIGAFAFSFVAQFIAFHEGDEQSDEIERILLFSLDSCNPEYISPDYMPKLYSALKEEGIVFKNGWAPLAAETMNGHTTIMTGCNPNSTGVIGNGYYDSELGKEVQNPIQDPEHRFVKTIFEDLKDHHPKKAAKTGFVSGKWRLPDFLALDAKYVFASSTCKTFDVCPKGYESIVGAQLLSAEGDIYDQWVIRALTELIRKDDPEFVFVNLAWTDDAGHDTGTFNANQRRQLLELDDLLDQFFTDLKEMGKYKTSMFIFTSDHGHDTINKVFNAKAFLEDNGIPVEHIHIEGGSGFIFLESKSDKDEAVKLLKQRDELALVLPREEMYKVHLDTLEERTGQIYISVKEFYDLGIADLSQIGSHGGISARDVPMAFMGPTLKEGEFMQDIEPNLADLVPTIYDIWGYDIPEYMDGVSIYGEIKE